MQEAERPPQVEDSPILRLIDESPIDDATDAASMLQSIVVGG
jgi:hypothetical protein